MPNIVRRGALEADEGVKALVERVAAGGEPFVPLPENLRASKPNLFKRSAIVSTLGSMDGPGPLTAPTVLRGAHLPDSRAARVPIQAGSA